MKFYYKSCEKWAILEKIQMGEGVGVEDMEFLVVYIEEKEYGYLHTSKGI